ncbi:abasic site processing protein HMCES [Neocloeon triangulifer]|uniref:abasic site processing protein HMCES n=1 Tax=Neocloeon triangulifer TaxID=2078957 RepID=UPI00286FA9AA|nr:abasic site processing protein HMCES [Neocloeon triangulifer]XP_059491044.1 abasic site processing protein HMCES [Neocloeon triangulifer]
MCGRLACTLNKQGLRRSCALARQKCHKKKTCKEEPHQDVVDHKQSPNKHQDKIKTEPVADDEKELTSEDEEPEWVDSEVESLEYKINHNLSPTQTVPCLLKQDGQVVITPMLWGFIPIGHKGTATDHGLSTFNARCEGVLKSPLFRHAFKTGKRCAVLCTGFYEWKTIDGKKQPFFFHLPQEHGVLVDEPCKDEEGKDYHGPRVTPLAGIYHHWVNAKGEKVPNVTIITMNAGKWVSWCHNRMPVVLDTPEKLNNWIDFDRVDAEEAEKMFVEPQVINWYPVKKDFYSAKPDHPLKPIRVGTSMLVPEFLTEWDKHDPAKLVEPPEPGSHKTSVKRASSPLKDSPSKKQATLSKWFGKKEAK